MATPNPSAFRQLFIRLGAKSFVIIGSLLAVLIVSTPAIASISIDNFMRATFGIGADGLKIYQYGSGTDHSADFSTGSHTSTVNNGGVLELGGVGPDGWWDLAWTHRQCFEVKSTDLVNEYPLRFEVDTTGSLSNGDDIRVVEGTNGTLLTSYSEGPFVDSASVVWAQAEPLAAGVSDYCIYFSNSAAASVSDEGAAFSYTSGQTVTYYTMLDTYNNDRFDVISYSDNNTVSDGTTTVTINAGQSHTFNRVDRNTVITATGPIEGSRDKNSADTLLPEGYADNEFINSVTRFSNGAWVRSPHANTTIQAIRNGAVINSVNVGPASGSVFVAGDFNGNDTVILRSTDGTDFLAMWKTRSNTDTMLAAPWFGDPIYGVRSRSLYIGAIGTATVQAEGSDGTSLSLAVSDTASVGFVVPADNRGDGTAFELSSDGPVIAAHQTADGNGAEATSFLPKRLLGQTWLLPIDANYFTVACPTNPTTLTVGGSTFNCASPNASGPGFFYPGLGNYPTGTKIEASHPIFVYYESDRSNDETNLVGVRGAIPYLRDIAYGPKPVEVLGPVCGEWVSPALATSGVFGTFSSQMNTPLGTSVKFQISTDGSAFYGPDGTAATSFSDGDIVPYVADFASTLQIRIELCADSPALTPSVTLASVSCDLDELVPDVSIVSPVAVASPTSGTFEPLLRVYQEVPGPWSGWVEYGSGTNITATDASFTTDHPSTQVDVFAGTVSAPSPTFSHATTEPYTLFANHQTDAGQVSEMQLHLVDDQQVRTENAVRFSFSG